MISKYIGGFFASTCLLCPGLAFAQFYDGAATDFKDDMSFQVSIGFQIPLGSTNRQRLKDKPRFDFGVDLARASSLNQTGQWSENRVSLFDIGMYGSKDFSLRISDQELYGPTFTAIYADENEGETPEKKSSIGKGLLIGVGVAAVAVVTVSVLAAIEVGETAADCTVRPDRCVD